MRFKGTDDADGQSGTSGHDVLEGFGGADRLYGGGGRDVVLGGDGDDLLSGNLVIDNFFASSGGSDRDADRVDGGEGDDIVAGGWNDILTGGVGADTLELDTRGYRGNVTLDFSQMAQDGSVRLGAGSIAGFERIGALRLGRGDDHVILGELVPAPLLARAVDAGGGDDLIDCRGLLINPATVRGPNGVIIGGAYDVTGGAGDDVIFGSTFSDRFWGDDGNDRIVLGGGSDIADGGAGNDRFVVELPTTSGSFGLLARLTGGEGKDQVQLDGERADWSASINSSGEYYLFRTYESEPYREDVVRIGGIESVKFADGVVAFRNIQPGLVIGTEASERLAFDSPGFAGSRVTAGDDLIHGLGGDDTLDGGRGADTYYGGEGTDTFIVSEAGDRVMDGQFDDTVFAAVSYADESGGGIGTVVLTGTDAIDATAYYALAITGNAGDNRLRGAIGETLLEGGAGDDTLSGGIASYEHAEAGVTVDLSKVGVAQDTRGAGIDTIGAYVSGIRGSAFDDVLIASDHGGDRLDGGPGDDKLIGGRYNDYADYTSATAAVTVNLSVTTAQDTGGAGVDTLRSIEYLQGSAFGDVLTGNGRNNYILGGDGDDRIDGDGGRRDELAGGAGADTFVFRFKGEVLLDDFLGTDGDRLDFSAIDADPSMPGNQAFHVVSQFTGNPGELVIARSESDGDSVTLDFNGDHRADLTLSFYYGIPDNIADLLVL